MPPIPDVGEQARVEALLRAFGSDEVLTLWERWLEIVREIAKDDFRLRLYRDARDQREDSGIDHAEVWAD